MRKGRSADGGCDRVDQTNVQSPTIGVEDEIIAG